MAKKAQVQEQAEREFNFPAHNVTVKARDMEEAIEKLNSILKQSEND